MQNTKLFVRNISFNTTDVELTGLFSEHGQVVSARVATDRETGRPRGFAFVEMSTTEGAEEAIRSLNNFQWNGRVLYVAASEPRENRASTAYGSRN